MSLVKDDLSTYVRNFVHYDNLVSSLNKQVSDTRKLRDLFESRIINELKEKHLENAIIQIVGGKLRIIEDRHIETLTYKLLEESLHSYFTTKKLMDDTSNIIKYIKSQRSVEITHKIKKISQLPEQNQK